MQWSHALTDYKNYLRIERGLSNNTILNYALDVEKLIAYLKGHEMELAPEKITTSQLQQFLYETAKTHTARSRSRLISGLKSFFNYLVFEEYREDNPMDLIETPKIGRKLPDPLSIEEIDRMIQAIDLTHPQGERNRAIIELLYSCGLRVSELLDLRLSDLYFEEGFIKVTGKGNKERLVPIAAQTQKVITIYKNELRIHTPVQAGHQDTLFLNRRGQKLSRAMIFTIVKELASAANIKKNISPHTFRHSFASHLLKNGADLRAIQLMLGHESITTTEIYMHTDRSQLADTLMRYHPRNK
ncbi:site-specific tyrosine recombinase XerD [Croceiramulus getboli]|nr:site-specific tyrosine recombinase XerD [Flavobacteriaceae bacterium YJPT1-3]